MKNPLKYLLLSSYSLAKYFVSKKKKQHVIIRVAILLFTQIPFYSIISLFLIIVGRLPFKLPYMFRFFVLVAIASSLITHWYGKKKLNEWHIEEAYKLLSKKQIRVRNMLFFIVSWVVFICLFILA